MFDHQILLGKSDTSQTSDQVLDQIKSVSNYYCHLHTMPILLYKCYKGNFLGITG